MLWKKQHSYKHDLCHSGFILAWLVSGDQGSDSMASETRSCSTKDDFASSEETVGSVTTDFESALADDAAKTGLDDKSNDLEKRKTVPEMQPDEI